MLTEIKLDTFHYFIDENGLKQGEYKSFHADGQLWVHTFFINGKQHGEFKTYHINGKLSEHSFYLNGKRHGEYNAYHDNGKMWLHSFCLNGKLHGEYKTYYDNGNLNHATFYYQGTDLNVNPEDLSEKDKVYIMMSGRLPPKN